MTAFPAGFIIIALIVSVILLRIGVYYYYVKRNLVELTEQLMHENVALQLTVYNRTAELVEQYDYSLKQVDGYYILYDDEKRQIKRGLLTEVYIAMYNEVKLEEL